MKTLLITAVTALALSAPLANANELTWGGYGEYQIEAEALEFGAVASYSVDKVTLSAETVIVKAKGVDMDLDSVTFGAAYAVNTNASVYAEVDLDSDLNYQETTVGAAFKF